MYSTNIVTCFIPNKLEIQKINRSLSKEDSRHKKQMENGSRLACARLRQGLAPGEAVKVNKTLVVSKKWHGLDFPVLLKIVICKFFKFF